MHLESASSTSEEPRLSKKEGLTEGYKLSPHQSWLAFLRFSCMLPTYLDIQHVCVWAVVPCSTVILLLRTFLSSPSNVALVVDSRERGKRKTTYFVDPRRWSSQVLAIDEWELKELVKVMMDKLSPPFWSECPSWWAGGTSDKELDRARKKHLCHCGQERTPTYYVLLDVIQDQARMIMARFFSQHLTVST